VDKLIKMIKKIDELHMVIFFPWYRYSKLEFDKKQTVLDENRKWNYLFRSVVVRGFIDNDDSVPMWA
jgi:hypothetical protein